jgi:hypothetical protein
MSTAELKIEIEKLIPDASENALVEALDILKKDLDASKEKSERAAHIKLILEEDIELLKRLAQ